MHSIMSFDTPKRIRSSQDDEEAVWFNNRVTKNLVITGLRSFEVLISFIEMEILAILVYYLKLNF